MAAKLIRGKVRVIDENEEMGNVKFVEICPKCGREVSGIHSCWRGGVQGVGGAYCSRCDEFTSGVDFVWD